MYVTRQQVVLLVESTESWYQTTKDKASSITFLQSRINELIDEQVKQASPSISNYEKVQANLLETLRGIASMSANEGMRMKAWAKDGLAGFTNSIHSTLLEYANNVLTYKKAHEASEVRAAQLSSKLSDLRGQWENQHNTITRLQDERALNIHWHNEWNKLTLRLAVLQDSFQKWQTTVAAATKEFNDTGK